MKTIAALLLFVCGISYSQADGYAKSSDGTSIYYRTFGKGKPILIINGGPGMNSNGFETLAKKLGEHDLSIIFDQRGTGNSVVKNPDESNITMDLMVADIETLRKEFRFESWIVLGHSFGGMLASYYTSKYPERVQKLILSSSGGIDLELLAGGDLIESRLDKAHRDSLAYWNNKIRQGETSYAARLGRGRAMAPAYVVDPKFYDTLAKRLTQTNRDVNALVWRNLSKIRFDCAPGLKAFRNQALIIQGKQDIVPATLAYKAHEAIPGSRVVLLDNCSHYGWLDAEEAYFSEIADFLKS